MSDLINKHEAIFSILIPLLLVVLKVACFEVEIHVRTSLKVRRKPVFLVSSQTNKQTKGFSRGIEYSGRAYRPKSTILQRFRFCPSWDRGAERGGAGPGGAGLDGVGRGIRRLGRGGVG
jgi:hypothetical protein